MIRTGKQKAMDKANKSMQERILRENGFNEPEEQSELEGGLEVGTEIVTIKSKQKGRIQEIQYVVKLYNGETVTLRQGDFYNDSNNDGLPF